MAAGPPKFLKKLKDAEAVRDSTVKMEAVVQGEPEPTIKWTKEGKPVFPGELMIGILLNLKGKVVQMKLSFHFEVHKVLYIEKFQV